MGNFDDLEQAVNDAAEPQVALLLSEAAASPSAFLTATAATSATAQPRTYTFLGLDSDGEEEATDSLATFDGAPPPPPSSSASQPSSALRAALTAAAGPSAHTVVNQRLCGAPFRYDLGSLLGGSLLHLAVLRRAPGVVRLLLNAGADAGDGSGRWSQGKLRPGRALVDRLVDEEMYSGTPAALARHLGDVRLAQLLTDAALDAAATARVGGAKAAEVAALSSKVAAMEDAAEAAAASYKSTLAAWIGRAKELERALDDERQGRAALEAQYAAQFAEAKAKLATRFKAKMAELKLQLDVHKAEVDATIDDRVADARDKYAADNLALSARVAELDDEVAELKRALARMAEAGASAANLSGRPHGGGSLYAGLPAVPAYPHEDATLDTLRHIQATITSILGQGTIGTDFVQRGEDARALRMRIEPLFPVVDALLPYPMRPITVQQVARTVNEVADLLHRAQSKTRKVRADDFSIAAGMVDAAMAAVLTDVAWLLGVSTVGSLDV